MLKLKRKKKEEAAAEGAEEEKKEEKPEEKKEEKPAEAGGEAAPAEGEAAAGKKSKKKLIIIAAAAVVVLAGAGAGVYFSGILGGEHEGEEQAAAEGEEEAAHGEGGKATKVEGAPAYFELPQILVNLNTGGKQASFIKTTVTLELASEEDIKLVEANLPRLMDNYNTFLREMRASDLYGSAGVYRLREEMLIRANRVLAPVKVKDVLFREILVQ